MPCIFMVSIGKQSTFELSAAQSVQSKQLALMKEHGDLSYVQLIVSPVARAYETAIHATFTSDLPDSTIIDNHFAEKQMNTTFVSSGRASRHASSVAKDFIEKKFKKVVPMEDFIIPKETDSDFESRLAIAYKRIMNASSREEKSVEIEDYRWARGNE